MIQVLLLAMALLFTGDSLVQPIELGPHIRTVLFGDITKPKRIETLEEASKTLGADCANALCTQIKFETHDILLFEWSGSGQDKIVIYNIKDDTCTFEYVRGRTRDFREHTEAFSMPKDMSYKVIK